MWRFGLIFQYADDIQLHGYNPGLLRSGFHHVSSPIPLVQFGSAGWMQGAESSVNQSSSVMCSRFIGVLNYF